MPDPNRFLQGPFAPVEEEITAQDFTAEPVARVHLPARIPLGFHGSWIADL